MLLRNIRYVIANDLLPSAVDAMKRNVELNGLGDGKPNPPPMESGEADAEKTGNAGIRDEKVMTKLPKPKGPKVRVNEGDAW